MKYIINYGGKDMSVELPGNAVLSMDSIAAGEQGGHITVVRVHVEDKLYAAFVGAMQFYPETMEPRLKTWAR